MGDLKRPKTVAGTLVRNRQKSTFVKIAARRNIGMVGQEREAILAAYKKYQLVIMIQFGLLVSACSSPTCSGPRVTSPTGECEAYYYKTDYGNVGFITQALIQCDIENTVLGGNIVAFDNEIEAGVGFRWNNDFGLEVLLPAEAQNMDNPVGATPSIGTTKTATYLGRKIVYQFKRLPNDHPDANGCIPN